MRVVLFVVVLLAGCAGPGDAALKAGNYQQACSEWLAVRGGNARIINNIGYCYEAGYAVPQNIEYAKKYYQAAAEMGDDLAVRNMLRLGMSPPPPRQPAPDNSAALLMFGSQLLNQGRTPPPRPVNCQSTVNGRVIDTYCQ